MTASDVRYDLRLKYIIINMPMQKKIPGGRLAPVPVNKKLESNTIFKNAHLIVSVDFVFSLVVAVYSGHAWYKEAKTLCKTVEDKTDGKVKITMEFGGVDGSDTDIAQGVQNGTIDMYIGSTVGFNTVVTECDWVNLPYFMNTYDKVDELMYNKDSWAYKLLKSEAEDNGFTWLGITDCDFRWLSTNKKINSLDDLSKLKIRVPESPMFLNFFTALGASPTAMAITEVPSALQQKTIDGQDNGPIISYNNGFQQFNKYWCKTNHSFAPAVVVINPNSWLPGLLN